MALTTEQVAHVARLARLRLSSEELETMRSQLSNILAYIERLQEVDVSGVQPTAQVTGLSNVLRPDGVAESLPRSEVLANAAEQRDGMFKVKGIFEE